MNLTLEEKEALKSLLETEIMEVKDLIEHADEQDKLSLIKYLENLESILKKNRLIKKITA